MDPRDIARGIQNRRKKIKIDINLAGKAYESHSQIGQDKWLIENVFPGKRNGYFVEVGAADGELFSNAFILEKEFGWSGICIEADNQYFEQLIEHRTAICENACLMDKPGPVEFQELGVLGGIKQYFNDDRERPNIKTVKKHAVTLQHVLEKHKAPYVIDMLSIDTEGSEFLIMKNFPFHKYKFLAICIEHNNIPELRDNLRRLFNSNGYILAQHYIQDDWWIHESYYDDEKCGTPPFHFKLK